MEWLSIAVSVVSTFAIGMLIYRKQKKDDAAQAKLTQEWQATVSAWNTDASNTLQELKSNIIDLDDLIRRGAEQASENEQREIQEGLGADQLGDMRLDDDNAPQPHDVKKYDALLRARAPKLNRADYVWTRRPNPDDERRGNLGWYATDPDGVRYFVYIGRGTIVRESIPESLLNAWRAKTGLDLKDIDLDYQTGAGRGNHAWFIRTRDGQTWKITRGGQGRSTPTVSRIDEA